MIGALLAAMVAGPPWAGASGPVQRRAPEGAPNVLIFVTDDQRAADTLRILPSVRKWFQRRGTRFTQAYVTTPLCCPARASIMTGKYAHNHGVHKNNEGDEIPQHWTLQHNLWSKGYKTALAGKYLNGWRLEEPPPFFDHWAMQNYGYNNALFNVDGVVQRITEYSTLFITEKSVEFLRDFESEDPTPWFLYMAPFAAHKPYEPEERYDDAPIGKWPGNPAMREGSTRDKPAFEGRRISADQGRTIRRRQLRTLLSVDDAIGRVMHWLDQNGELQNTLAFFTSDNGRSWGEHRIGGKRTPYTESIKVPLSMRWPGTVAPGAVDRRLVTNLDIAATIFGAARIKPDHELDGMSLLADRSRKRLFFEHWGRYGRGVPDWKALRTKRYHFVHYYGRAGNRIFREFYDLRRDPWQLENLFGNPARRDDPSPRRLRRLKRLLRRYAHCSGDDCP